MGIGHVAVGFAAKRVTPRVSLALLILAGTFVDMLWGLFVTLGLEHARIAPGITAASPLDLYDYPISHSLLAGILWALLFGGVFFVFKRYRAGAVMLGALVLSHWFLDFVAHRPDMPLGLAGPYLGLGLWNSKIATIAVEEAMLAAGVWLYVGATTGGVKILAITVAVLAIMGVAGSVSAPPPDIRPIALSNLVIAPLGVLVAMAIERRRTSSAANARPSFRPASRRPSCARGSRSSSNRTAR